MSKCGMCNALNYVCETRQYQEKIDTKNPTTHFEKDNIRSATSSTILVIDHHRIKGRLTFFFQTRSEVSEKKNVFFRYRLVNECKKKKVWQKCDIKRNKYEKKASN